MLDIRLLKFGLQKAWKGGLNSDIQEPFISLTTFISSIASSQVGDMITDFLDNFFEFFESMVSKTFRANSVLESIGQLILSGS